MPIIDNTFAKQFAQVAQKSNKAAFEQRFDTVQRGLLKQLDKEKQKIADNGAEQEIAAVQKERDRLFERVDELRNLQTDIKTNSLRFAKIMEDAISLANNADADDSGSLSEEEAASLNTGKAAITNEIYKLKLSHEFKEFTDGNLANRLRQVAATLDGYTAVAGTMDAEGSGSPTNDNRNILDTLNDVSNRAQNYADSSTILFQGLNQVIIDTNTQAYDLEADLADLTAGKLSEQLDKISDLETRYGNLIRSISLAFEVQSGIGDMLANGTDFEAPAGSVLNLFA